MFIFKDLVFVVAVSVIVVAVAAVALLRCHPFLSLFYTHQNRKERSLGPPPAFLSTFFVVVVFALYFLNILPFLS